MRPHARRLRLRTALRRGLRLRVTLPASARVTLGATLRPATARRYRLARRIARRAATLPAGTTVIRLRPSRRAAARLRGARRVRLRIALASPHGAGSLTLLLRR